MNSRVMTTLLLLVAASAALATGASAQEGLVIPSAGDIQAAAVEKVGVELGPNQFGTRESRMVIPISAFMPASSPITYSTNLGYLSTPDGGIFNAYLDLPPGTEVREMCLFVYDGSATEDITVSWAIQMFGDMTEGPAVTNLVTAATSTADTPGYTMVCLNTGAWVPVSAFGDLDGDGDAEYSKHRVRVVAPATATMSFGGLAVQWRRAISPAPATATFPNDVPTSHPYFRFVEALAASGITAGCATGSYCPDATLTRGQMAVFLSAALGLYWPY